MSLFGSAYIGPINEMKTYQFEDGTTMELAPYLEALLVSEVSTLPDEQIQEFCKPGGVGEALVEAGKLRRKTLVRLSKKDDMQRRQTMAELELAKQANDPIYQKLVKLHIKMKEYDQKIHQRYGHKAEKVAKIQQKEYIKKNSGGFLTGGSTQAVR